MFEIEVKHDIVQVGLHSAPPSIYEFHYLIAKIHHE